ncbi:MAG: OmpA family protein, partial [Alcaligenaceae bacterium]|nr:OmpA family protein [Alcaligenaceae bacterium]
AGRGIAQGRLMSEGLGPSNPIGDNATAEGRALNRRVELFLYAVR